MPSNRLAHERSPYLLQHAHNPVDWYPWSDEAFARATAENKPIFLSIGYATCHWCHVMERESFEDEEAARALNAAFVCIKVDREERPDIDAVYMAACQMMTGGGGWPLTIFMTPDRRPFFAATYLPRRTRFGRQGLIELCERVRELWALEPQRVAASAAGIAESLGRAFAYAPAEAPGLRLLDRAYDDIAFGFDARHGGFEPAPKFPTPHRLLFLLRVHDRTGDARALEMVERTLAAMRLGGICDHVGHGIHRYSTDAGWLVPHFEKMLYDQALTALAALAARQVSGKPDFGRTAEEIFAYVLRDMTSAEGGFFSAEDADSEGVEGRFYVWTRAELRAALGADEAAFWEPVFNVTAEGNYREEAGGQPTGANILHLTRPLSAWARELGVAESDIETRWEAARARLFAAREARVHPLKDDKVLTDWNGLMIAALAEGARVLGSSAYEVAAERAARFVLAEMRGPDGRLFHRFRLGERAVTGQATDYAFMVHGLLHLYRATFRVEWAEEAAALQRVMVAELWDEAAGGFFLTGADERELPVRPKDLADGAAPSANSGRADEPALAVPADRRGRVGRARPDDGARVRGHGRAPPGGVRAFPLRPGLRAAARPGHGPRRRGGVSGRPPADRGAERGFCPQPGGALQVRGQRRPALAPGRLHRRARRRPGTHRGPPLRRRILQGIGHERGRPDRAPRGQAP